MKNSKKLACVFFSSPHADSYTSKLLKIFIDHAPNYRFITINAYRKNVSPCIDCGYCKSHLACKFKDMEDIDTYLKKADLLIFASPVYNFSFPAPMKAILDRMQRYFCARFHMNIKPPIEKKKNAVLIASCGSKDTLGIKIMEMQLKKIFTIINCKLVGTICFNESDNLINFPDNIRVKIKEIINNL